MPDVNLACSSETLSFQQCSSQMNRSFGINQYLIVFLYFSPNQTKRSVRAKQIHMLFGVLLHYWQCWMGEMKVISIGQVLGIFCPLLRGMKALVFYSYPLKRFSEKTILLNFKNYFVRCCIKCLILIEGASVFSFWNMMINWLWHILFFMILCNSRFSKWSQRCGCENFI